MIRLTFPAESPEKWRPERWRLTLIPENPDKWERDFEEWYAAIEAAARRALWFWEWQP